MINGCDNEITGIWEWYSIKTIDDEEGQRPTVNNNDLPTDFIPPFFMSMLLASADMIILENVTMQSHTYSQDCTLNIDHLLGI